MRQPDLADLPPLTDLAVLGDRDELQARAAAEPEVLPSDRYDRFDGAEESKSIWVSVDPRCRVSSVDISSTWRKRLEPDGFAGALFAAYSAAVRQAGAVGTRPGEPVPAGPEPVVPEADTEVWLSKVRAWSAAMDERLAHLASARFDPPDVREVRGPAGYVTLRLRGNVVVGMTANAAALKSANPNMVRQDVLDAFAAAEY